MNVARRFCSSPALERSATALFLPAARYAHPGFSQDEVRSRIDADTARMGADQGPDRRPGEPRRGHRRALKYNLTTAQEDGVGPVPGLADYARYDIPHSCAGKPATART